MTMMSLRCSVLTLFVGFILVHAAPCLAEDGQPATSPAKAPPAKAEASNGQGDGPASSSLDDRIARLEAEPTNLGLGFDLLDEDLSSKDRRRVLRAVRSLLKAHPKEPVPRFLAGLAQADAKGVDNMAQALDAGLAAPPDVVLSAWIRLRNISRTEQIWPICARAAEQVSDRSGTATDLLVLAQALSKLPGREEDTLRAYAAVIAKDPDHLSARTDLALLLVERGDVEAARELAEKTTERFPDSATAFLYLGMVRSLSGDPEGGRAAYAKALSCTDGDAGALAAVAAAYTELEDYEHATEALKKALDADPKHVGALTALGVLELEQGHPKVALDRLNVAAKAAPADARIQFLRGIAYERIERFTDATAAYKRALRIQPKHVMFVLALARALEAKGSAQTASTELRRALRYAPTDTRIHLQLGLVEMRRRRFGPALDALRRATQLAPEDPAPWFFIAVIQGDHRSKPEAALEALHQYKALGGSEPTALDWLARLEEALEKSKKKR